MLVLALFIAAAVVAGIAAFNSKSLLAAAVALIAAGLAVQSHL